MRQPGCKASAAAALLLLSCFVVLAMAGHESAAATASDQNQQQCLAEQQQQQQAAPAQKQGQKQTQKQQQQTTPKASKQGPVTDRLARVKAVWRQQHQGLAHPADVEVLRRQAWDMFDHGFSNYMQHAYPKDNLMPLSCGGKDWQGGLALTLVDALDTLVLLNRRADLQEAVEHLRQTLSFDKDEKVHVFETTIRVLGGLLSGHVLLQSDPGLVPGYDGLLLRFAADLGDRLLAAFDTPSGLPGGHVHLQKGIVAGENISCTACAGTLLMEFGLLSQLTGNNRYMAAAHHAATVLYDRRSPLGLVGSSFHVGANTWTHLGSTIGPGSDSYYEYLLKAYLMFGDRAYLDMFIELYAATMKHMQLPRGTQPPTPPSFGSAFLLDVHMDSGRLLKPWVSSLGAFWPAMQVLAGQSDDAKALHRNFTSAWAQWGWLPEVFGVDLGSVHPEDPGYNLRPEHIESTWYLAALTGDPTGAYRGCAANMLAVLNHSWVGCGYAPIADVATGSHTDLMESYFLSETVKYLYLSFVDAGALLDYYVLSTEGHIMPSAPNPVDTHVEEDDHLEVLILHYEERLRQQEEQHVAAYAAACVGSGDSEASCAAEAAAAAASARSRRSGSIAGITSTSSSSSITPEEQQLLADLSLLGDGLSVLPANCRPLCAARSREEEEAVHHTLHRALPLLPLDLKASRRIRYRRCVACIKTTQTLADMPSDPLAARLARFNFGQTSAPHETTTKAAAADDAAGGGSGDGGGSSSSSKEGSSSGSGTKKQSAGSSSSSSSNAKQQQQQQPSNPRAAAVAARRASAYPSNPLSTDIEALPSAQGVVVLAQALCLMKVVGGRRVECDVLRPVTALDTTSMLPQNAVVLQLSGLKAEALPAAAPVLHVALETEDEGLSTLQLSAALAAFGPEVPLLSDGCVAAMQAEPPHLARLPSCPPHITLDPYWRPPPTSASSSSSSNKRTKPAGAGGAGGQHHQHHQHQQQHYDVWQTSYWQWQQRQQLAADPWLLMSPSSTTCEAVRAAHHQQHTAAAAGAGDAGDGGEAASHNSSQTPDSSSSSTSSLLSSRVLLGNCLGYDPSTLLSGFWLPQPTFFNASHPCSSPLLSAAAAASAEEVAAPGGAALPMAAPLVLAHPPDACRKLRNADSLVGSIVVVKRGGCSFVDKAEAAAAAGAFGVVILNNESPGQLLTMSDDGSGRAPEIPVVMLEANDSVTLLFWLMRRPLLGSLLSHSSPPVPGRAQLSSATTLLAVQGGEKQQEQQEEKLKATSKERDAKKSIKKGGGGSAKEGQPDGGSSSNSSSSSSSSSVGDDADNSNDVLHTRIDLFVPGRSQPWLQTHVIKAGIDGQVAYQSLAQDARVLLVLQQAYARNKAHNHGVVQQLQAPLTGRRAASSSSSSNDAKQQRTAAAAASGG